MLLHILWRWGKLLSQTKLLVYKFFSYARYLGLIVQGICSAWIKALTKVDLCLDATEGDIFGNEQY